MFLADLADHLTVMGYRLRKLDEEKHRATCMKLRGGMDMIDFINSLPESVKEWKKK